MSKSKFYEQLNAIINKIIFINTNLHIYKKLLLLCANGKPYESVYKKTYRFWDFIAADLTSHNLIEISKLYDEHRGVLGLRKLIDICSQNHDWYFECEGNTDLTMKDFNDFIKTLNAEYSSVAQITQELKKIRDTKAAHADKKYILDKSKNYENFTWKDFEQLVSVASRICNMISGRLYNKTFIMEVDAENDLNLLIQYAAKGMNN